MTTTVVALSLLSLLPSLTRAVEVEVLPPVTDTGPEAALLIVPGAYITGQAYRPLGKAIQANSTLRLWVALLEDFLFNLANPLQLGGAVDRAVTELKAKGMASDDIFIAGHSLGGGVVSQYAESHSHRFKGVLFFGHFPDFPLSQFPLPVLTLSGDLDGLVRLTHMMDKFEELTENMGKDPDALTKTSVLLVEGVNHGQFASGDMPSTVRQNDLTSDVIEVVAHARIAKTVTSFLSVHVQNVSDAEFQHAKTRLEETYNATREIYRPLLQTRADDKNPDVTSQWSKHAQSLVAGVEGVVFQDREMDASHFTDSKPTITKTPQGTISVSTVTQLVYGSSLFSQSTSPVSPLELQVKMASREAILNSLPSNMNLPTDRPLQTCEDINQASLNLALSRASRNAVQRYTTRGRHIKFSHDRVTTASAIWQSTKLDFSETAENVTVTSAVYAASGEGPTSGVMYCKLLSPFRAMEWVYVDSLRPFVGQHSIFAVFG